MSTSNGSDVLRAVESEEDRSKMLSEAFDLSLSDDEVENEPTPATASPPAAKTKPPVKGPTAISRLKQNRSAGASPGQARFQATAAATSPHPAHGAVRPSSAVAAKTSRTIEGSNIGEQASEPAWTPAELQQFADLAAIKINVVSMAETRRSVADPEGKYLVTGDSGTTVTRPAAMLPNITWNEFSIGIGKAKADEKTGKGKIYCDIVMRGQNWLLSQWTSKNVIMEGVADNILDAPPRMTTGKMQRRIGHNFVRIGLPKTSFTPIFETLKGTFASVLDEISITRGYYWVNASWGVTGVPGSFVYVDANRTKVTTTRLNEAMKMISGYSSIGAATIAISISSPTKIEAGKAIPTNVKYDLSIKIHNMFHVKKVPYHSPPQAAAVGFEVADDMYDGAESLEPLSGMTSMMDSTASMFNTNSLNPFLTTMGTLQAPQSNSVGTDRLL